MPEINGIPLYIEETQTEKLYKTNRPAKITLLNDPLHYLDFISKSSNFIQKEIFYIRLNSNGDYKEIKPLEIALYDYLIYEVQRGLVNLPNTSKRHYDYWYELDNNSIDRAVHNAIRDDVVYRLCASLRDYCKKYPQKEITPETVEIIFPIISYWLSDLGFPFDDLPPSRGYIKSNDFLLFRATEDLRICKRCLNPFGEVKVRLGSNNEPEEVGEILVPFHNLCLLETSNRSCYKAYFNRFMKPLWNDLHLAKSIVVTTVNKVRKRKIDNTEEKDSINKANINIEKVTTKFFNKLMRKSSPVYTKSFDPLAKGSQVKPIYPKEVDYKKKRIAECIRNRGNLQKLFDEIDYPSAQRYQVLIRPYAFLEMT